MRLLPGVSPQGREWTPQRLVNRTAAFLESAAKPQAVTRHEFPGVGTLSQCAHSTPRVRTVQPAQGVPAGGLPLKSWRHQQRTGKVGSRETPPQHRDGSVIRPQAVTLARQQALTDPQVRSPTEFPVGEDFSHGGPPRSHAFKEQEFTARLDFQLDFLPVVCACLRDQEFRPPVEAAARADLETPHHFRVAGGHLVNSAGARTGQQQA